MLPGMCDSAESAIVMCIIDFSIFYLFNYILRNELVHFLLI
jgi:hypothetical protein